MRISRSGALKRPVGAGTPKLATFLPIRGVRGSIREASGRCLLPACGRRVRTWRSSRSTCDRIKKYGILWIRPTSKMNRARVGREEDNTAKKRNTEKRRSSSASYSPNKLVLRIEHGSMLPTAEDGTC